MEYQIPQDPNTGKIFLEHAEQRVFAFTEQLTSVRFVWRRRMFFGIEQAQLFSDDKNSWTRFAAAQIVIIYHRHLPDGSASSEKELTLRMSDNVRPGSLVTDRLRGRPFSLPSNPRIPDEEDHGWAELRIGGIELGPAERFVLTIRTDMWAENDLKGIGCSAVTA